MSRFFKKCSENICEIYHGEQFHENPNFVELWVLPLWWLNKERPCQSGSSSSELAAYNNPKQYTQKGSYRRASIQPFRPGRTVVQEEKRVK
jgi:hypothetical protein